MHRRMSRKVKRSGQKKKPQTKKQTNKQKTNKKPQQQQQKTPKQPPPKKTTTTNKQKTQTNKNKQANKQTKTNKQTNKQTKEKAAQEIELSGCLKVLLISSTTLQALTWNPQGKRKRGRPRNSWRRDTEAELKQQGTNWSGMARAAQNRVRWLGVVDGLCSTGSDGHKYK